MNDSPGALELLSERVDELEKRVRALEHPAIAEVDPRAQKHLPAPAAKPEPALETSSIFPVIGRALLGIAGAYILRAIAASGAMPKLLLSAVAVAYAFGWLVWSSLASNRVKRTVYAATSALILTPMLWENTLGFHVFTPTTTAGVLAAFLTLATILDLRSSGLRGMDIAPSLVILIAAALGFATFHGLPFIAALLIGLSVSEFARARALPQPLWPLLAVVSDLMVSGLIFVYSGPAETRVQYPLLGTAALIAPATILFAINASSIAVRVVARQCAITIFETLQPMIAFGLAVTALLLFSPHGGLIVGIVCLLLSACSYVCALRYLAPRAEPRSFRIFALWSAALLIAGSQALPLISGVTLLSAAAIAATWGARRMQPGMLELHAALFILAAAIVAGLPQYLYACVAATPPHSLAPAVIIVTVSDLAAFVLGRLPADSAGRRLLHLLRALIPVLALTAITVHGALAAAGSAMEPGPHHVAFLRTLAICAVALGIALGGSRWGVSELTQLAWALLAGVGIKLLLEDLRHGHMGLAAASIALFAFTLMSVPRLVRIGAKMHAASAPEPTTTKREASV
jgi:hypothetical protein